MDIVWIDSEKLSGASDTEVAETFKGVHGILIPGGFGGRAIDGKLNAIKWARENKVPFLGICLGLQCAVIETARNVLGIDTANSTEFDPDTLDPVVDLMPEQKRLPGILAA